MSLNEDSMMDVQIEDDPASSPPQEPDHVINKQDVHQTSLAKTGQSSSTPVGAAKDHARSRANIAAMRAKSGGGRYNFLDKHSGASKTPPSSPSKITASASTSTPLVPTAKTTPPLNFINLDRDRSASPLILPNPTSNPRKAAALSAQKWKEESVAIDYFETLAKEEKVEETFGEIMESVDGKMDFVCPWNGVSVTIDTKTYCVIDHICDVVAGKSKGHGPSGDDMVRQLLKHWRIGKPLPWVPAFENQVGAGQDAHDQQAVANSLIESDDDAPSSFDQDVDPAIEVLSITNAHPHPHPNSPHHEASPLHEIADDDEIMVTGENKVPLAYKEYSGWSELNADYRCWSEEEVRGLRKAVIRNGMLQEPKEVQKYMNEKFRPSWTNDFGFEERATKVWSICLIHRRSIVEREQAITAVQEGWKSLTVRTVFDKGLYLLDEDRGALWEGLDGYCRDKEGGANAPECLNGPALRSWFRQVQMPLVVNARIPPHRGYNKLLCPDPPEEMDE